MTTTPDTHTHGILLAVTIRPGTDLNAILQDLANVCAGNPSIAEYDVEDLGEIECYDGTESGVVKES